MTNHHLTCPSILQDDLLSGMTSPPTPTLDTCLCKTWHILLACMPWFWVILGPPKVRVVVMEEMSPTTLTDLSCTWSTWSSRFPGTPNLCLFRRLCVNLSNQESQRGASPPPTACSPGSLLHGNMDMDVCSLHLQRDRNSLPLYLLC